MCPRSLVKEAASKADADLLAQKLQAIGATVVVSPPPDGSLPVTEPRGADERPSAGWARGAQLAIELLERAERDDTLSGCSIDSRWRKNRPHLDIVTPVLAELTDEERRAGFAAMLSHVLSSFAHGSHPNPAYLEVGTTVPMSEVAAEWSRISGYPLDDEEEMEESPEGRAARGPKAQLRFNGLAIDEHAAEILSSRIERQRQQLYQARGIVSLTETVALACESTVTANTMADMCSALRAARNMLDSIASALDPANVIEADVMLGEPSATVATNGGTQS